MMLLAILSIVVCSTLMALVILRLGIYSSAPIFVTLILISVYFAKEGNIIPLSCVIGTGVLALILRVTRSLSSVLVLAPWVVIIWVLMLSQFAEPYLEKLLFQVKEVFSEFENQLLENAELNNNKQATNKLISQLPELSGNYLLGNIALIQMILSLMSLFFARSLQSRLYNPEGWRKEFHQLRFTRIGLLTLLFGILGCTSLVEFQYWTWLFALPLLVSGVAIVHSCANIKKLNGQWLIGFYIILIIFAPLIPILILLVMIDHWIDVRGRLQQKINNFN